MAIVTYDAMHNHCAVPPRECIEMIAVPPSERPSKVKFAVCQLSELSVHPGHNMTSVL